MNQNLITWAQYCGITGTSLTDSNQTLITTYIIPGVSNAIELYCDRDLVQNTYQEFLTVTEGNVFPSQFPITKLFAVQSLGTVVSAVNSGTANYTLSVNDAGVDIWDAIAGSGTSYAIGTYPTLGSLLTQLGIDYPAIVFSNVISSSLDLGLILPATYNLSPSTSADIQGAVTTISGRISGHEIGIVGIPGPASFPGFGFDYGYSNQFGMTICVTYLAGYSPIPSDLQILVARACQDMLGQVNGSGSDPAMQSEKVSQYEYTRRPNLDYNALINTVYAAALMQYKRTVFA